MKRVAVIGCGIIGLTAAIRLQKAGYHVQIIARDLPPTTTSNKAAAIWEPYKAEPKDKVAQWSAETYDRYVSEYKIPAAGVSEVELIAVSKSSLPPPFWLRPAYPFRRLSPGELPAGYQDGYAVMVPFIHSGRYLDYLLQHFATKGGDIALRHLSSLADIGPGFYAIVNCSGLGARTLVRDEKVYPIRGQLAVVSRPGPARFIVDDTSYADPVYVLSRDNVCILGGTAEERSDLGDEDRDTREIILARCRVLDPALADSIFLRPVVGFRPGREEVRLEVDPEATSPRIVHNYGHGGAGFTVAWGCANEVIRLLSE